MSLETLREVEESIQALVKRREALCKEIAQSRAASNIKRKQLEVLARNVPEIGTRAHPVRRLELLLQMSADPPASPHSLSRETGALRERVWALNAKDVSGLQEMAKACAGDEW